MTRSRRLFAALLSLCPLLFFCLSASAEETHAHLSVSATANPDHMVLAQDVDFTFEIQNTGDTDAYSVIVLFPEANGQYSVGQIAAGETAEASFSYPVTEEDLDKGSVSFAISHQDSPEGESIMDESVTLPLTRELEAPAVEFTRQVSNRFVHAGDTVTLAYQIKNTGNVALTSVAISDPLGGYSDSLDSLPMDGSHTFMNKVTLEQSSASMPTVTFVSAASGQSYSKSLSSSSITLADEAIFAQLAASKTEVSYGESITLTLTLTNGGNVSFSDITLTDSALGVLENEPLSLPSGAAPVVIARNCVMKSDTVFQVHVTGSTNAGTPFEVDTDPVTVTVLQGEGAASLSLTAEPSARTLSEPGMVSFQLTLTNNGQSDLTHVTLSEATRGEVRTFDVIPAGDPTVREQMYDVTESGTFVFEAQLQDSDGTLRTITTEPIEITINSVGGQTPQATSKSGIPALLENRTLPIGGLSLYPMLIGAALILLILLIIALVISNRKKRKQRSVNRAERKSRSERFGKTNKFTPVRKSNQTKRGK